MDEEEFTDKQSYNNEKVAPLRPFQWKKGQSGNPAGRPKGKTMKEYAKELLACQTEEERQEFLHGLSKDIIWQMAEGRPSQGIGQAEDLDKLVLNIISYKDDNNNDTIPVSSEELPVGIVEGTATIQDSSIPPTSGEIKDGTESASSEITT